MKTNTAASKTTLFSGPAGLEDRGNAANDYKVTQAAEVFIIGSIIGNNDLYRFASTLSEKDFAFRSAAIAFKHIRNILDGDHETLKTVTVFTLNSIAEVSAHCGADTISQWAQVTPGSDEAFKDAVSVVVAASQTRRSENAILAAQEKLLGGTSAHVVTDALIGDLQKIQESRSASCLSMGDIAINAIQDIAYRVEAGISENRLKTHFNELDDILGGLNGGDLILIGGRPAMGKSSLAMSVLSNISRFDNKASVLCSLEMLGPQLSMRMVSNISGVELSHIKSGAMSADQWESVISAAEEIKSLKVGVIDDTNLSFFDFVAEITRLNREGCCDILVIDYIQLLEIDGYGANRQAMISDISRRLKKLAMRLNIPVVALSQLNRGLEARPNKRPMNSDLRESGSLEQDADVIMFVYRDEVYHPETIDKGIAEVLVTKHRDGPIGVARLLFEENTATFKNGAPLPRIADPLS